MHRPLEGCVVSAVTRVCGGGSWQPPAEPGKGQGGLPAGSGTWGAWSHPGGGGGEHLGRGGAPEKQASRGGCICVG